MILSPLTARRFWSKVQMLDKDSCWLWSSALSPTGYGAFRLEGQTVRAHRIAYALSKGPLVEGQVIMHLCETKACCNPAHLHQGTQAENLRQAGEAGKMTRAVGVNSMCKLSEEALEDIRSSQEGQRAYSRKYGVDHKTIARIQKAL